MSGQVLLKRVLVEKEKAIGRRQLVNAYIGLASSFVLTACGYSTLTYLAAQPALSHSPDAGGQPKAAPLSIASLNEPESGVKLLLSIFSRLGESGARIAMVPEGGNRWAYRPNAWGVRSKSLRDEEKAIPSDQIAQQTRVAPEAQFNQALSSNAADPALSIRPQVNKRASVDEFVSSNLPSQQSMAQSQPQSQLLGQSQTQTQAQSQMLAQAAPQAMRGSLQQNGWYKSPMQVKISDSPDIREFTPSSKTEAGTDNRKAFARRQVNVVEEPMGRARLEHQNLIEQSKDLSAASGADNVTGIIRPSEQPGLFKYVREYYKDSLKNMPAPASTPAGATVTIPQILDGSPIVTDARTTDDKGVAGKQGMAWSTLGGAGLAGGGGGAKSVAASYDIQKESENGQAGYKASNFSAAKKKRASLMLTAFLPPNAVHGISGLSLGASAAETTAFFRNHGKYGQLTISGFQILSLKGEKGTIALQAFVRDDRLEALRVFNSTFVPQQLGVNLGEDLPSMKAKFGEPAFILEEPRVKAKAPPVVAKNYVYPVSQVSFQLSRPSAASAPQVLSLLLFRFL